MFDDANRVTVELDAAILSLLAEGRSRRETAKLLDVSLGRVQRAEGRAKPRIEPVSQGDNGPAGVSSLVGAMADPAAFDRVRAGLEAYTTPDGLSPDAGPRSVGRYWNLKERRKIARV